MRRVVRALLRASAAPSAQPAAAAAVPRVLLGWAAGERREFTARGGRASSSAAPTGWAASVLEDAARSLHGADVDDDDDELEASAARRKSHSRRLVSPAQDQDDDDDDLDEDEDDEAEALTAGMGNTLVWPPPPEVLRNNPALAELVRPAGAPRPASARAARC